MNEQILINVTPQETRVAIMEQGAVQELHIERASMRGLVGNIYLGRVARVIPGMQSAFIDIGLDRAAFLHIADIWGAKEVTKEIHRETGKEVQKEILRPIERMLQEGQSLLVQVIKDPIGTKGARLSTQISMAGRMLVYLPQDPHIGISQRIEDQAEREHLREKVHELMPKGEPGGFIVRTNAETASDEALKSDINYLVKLWQRIRQDATTAKSASLIHRDLDISLRVLRDFVHESTERIVVDDPQTFQDMHAFAELYTRSALSVIEYYSGDRPLFDLFGVEEEIERALSRRVELKSGGYLIIDQTEALTTIDVNTGAFVTGRSFDDTIFRTNLEAAQSIARQLRLRNLGGIVIADFIDMDNDEHQNGVLNELRKALSKDRARVNASGFSQLGLVEMTRKRTRESLAHVLCEPCPACKGRGELKTPQTVCYEILRELMRAAKQFAAKEYRILASQSVIDLFLDEESQALAHAGDVIGKPVSLQVETAYNQEQYDVVLM
jgi:ribonuclease G